MPSREFPRWVGEVKRNSFLLDTNVLYAGFVKEDRYHEQASYFLEEVREELLIPIAVLVEAWGLIVGRQRRRDIAAKMMAWVNTPGKAIVLPQPVDGLVKIQELVDSVQVDCVDALLFDLVLRLEKDLRDLPLVRVATYDTSDFYRCMRSRGVRIEIFDMRDSSF